MIKITEAQRELLARAAADPEGVVDAPEDAKVGRPLIKHGLAISLPVTGGGSRLSITNAGRAMLAPDQQDDSQAGAPAAPPEPPEDTPQPPTEGLDESPADPVGEPLGVEAAAEPVRAAGDKRPGGKLGTMVDLLSRPSGATLDEMVTATGWQTHSVRGAMSGGLKKKLGLNITSTKTDGTRVYRLVTEEAA